MSVERFDVAIVGAGPSGSSAAISLAQMGYGVVLLDKALFPREKLCGDFINPANWELLERLGVADEILSLPHEKITAFRISTGSGEQATAGFPSKSTGRPFGLGLRRYYLDDLLLRAAEKAGAAVKRGCKVGAFDREGGGWSISLDGSPAGDRLKAAFLIGADGRNSLVAHRLGLSRKGESAANYLAFQAHLKRVRGVQGDVQIHAFAQGYAGLVGVGGGMANLCFVVEKKKAQEERSLEHLLEHCLYRNSHLRESLRESEIVGDLRSAFPVYFSSRRCYGDGFLMVGDAARVTEPVTGEGIYFALKSGILAAQAMDLALKKRHRSAESFSTYERSCRSSMLFRQTVNALVRALIYRPLFLRPMVQLAAKGSFPLGPLVARLCRRG